MKPFCVVLCGFCDVLYAILPVVSEEAFVADRLVACFGVPKKNQPGKEMQRNMTRNGDQVLMEPPPPPHTNDRNRANSECKGCF